MKPEDANTCLIDSVRNGTMPSDLNSSEVKITTWGIRCVGDVQFEIKDKGVVYGRVAKIAEQQRVIVELFGGCFVVTAYVPKDRIKKIIS